MHGLARKRAAKHTNGIYHYYLQSVPHTDVQVAYAEPSGPA